ncbi:MAG: hypothetical protein KA059_09380 [Elusimicrobiales bacterium]|nr:hypothetical protein [Elusimicrobiales bacterium]
MEENNAGSNQFEEEEVKEVEKKLEAVTPEKPKNLKKTKKDSNNKKTLSLSQIILIIFICFCINAASFIIYDKFFAQKIYVVDLRSFIEEQKDMYMAGKLTDEKLRANFDKMEKKINSLPKNRIPISAEVVLGKNAPMLLLNQ